MALETGWLPETAVDDNLVRQFLHAQAAANEELATTAGGRAARHGEVALAHTGGPIPFFNQAVLLRPLVGADDPLLDEVESFHDAAPQPASLLSAWPTPDLTGRGWFRVGHPALVVRSPGAFEDDGRWDVPGDVEVVEATTPELLAMAERVLVEGYPMPAAIGAPVGTVVPQAMVGGDMRFRIASVDGEPVAVGAVHLAHGLVNLCGGATLPAARRRGAWRALVRARVAEDLASPAVAYTSDDSRPGFLRLGFLVVTRFTLWGRGNWS